MQRENVSNVAWIDERLMFLFSEKKDHDERESNVKFRAHESKVSLLNFVSIHGCSYR